MPDGDVVRAASANAWSDEAGPVDNQIGHPVGDQVGVAAPVGPVDAWGDPAVPAASDEGRGGAVAADARSAAAGSAGAPGADVPGAEESGAVEAGTVEAGAVGAGDADPFEEWGRRRGESGEAVPLVAPGGAVEVSDDPFETLGRRRGASGEALPAEPGALRAERSADDPFEAPARKRGTATRDRSGDTAPVVPGGEDVSGGEDVPGGAEAGSGSGTSFDRAFEDASKGSSRGGPRGRYGRGRASGRRGSREVDPDAEAAPVDPVKEQRKATDICYALLTARARTRVELKEALLRKGIRPETAEVVLGRFDRAGLIDDAAFAEVWVRSRHAYQGLGRRALARELRQKGVADEVAAEAVAAVDDEAEQERARELVRKKLRSMSGVDDQAKIRRLVGALARKGYAEGMAYRVVREELRAAAVESPLDDFLPD
ncbi:regulatory protein RecX [Actinosynnema sp. NPDC023587]|uniref:regulatory protein RecX n=1 Tax=Actinosynnema sp. NPDC023587 TaxID=3154695 RepID=UPI0033C263EB